MDERYGVWKEQKKRGRETEKDKKVSSMYIYNYKRKLQG